MEYQHITEQDLHQFFQAFCQDFASFNGKKIAERYATPYISLNADGVLKLLASVDDIANYFQNYLNQYREQGCSDCRYDDLSFVLLGAHRVVVSVTWQLYNPQQQLVST
ncbi:MAG TPA: hypothetical protein PK211_08345, partial [Agitococcus sp.]|nr:hypothetical protein [Agitococcus sp.]